MLYYNRCETLLNKKRIYLFDSFNIIFFILSMSGKNKFIPLFFNSIKYLKLSSISFFNVSITFNGLPSIVWGWSIYFSNIGKAFWIYIAVGLLAISLIIIDLQLPFLISIAKPPCSYILAHRKRKLYIKIEFSYIFIRNNLLIAPSGSD